MKRMLAAATLFIASLSAWALQPYVAVDAKVASGNLKAAMGAVEQKLAGAGFTVVGRHAPQGMPNHGSIVIVDGAYADAVKAIGGTAVVAIPLRVGVKADGTVTYLNPEYWGRAFIRKDYGKAEAAAKVLAGKLATALGAGKPYGGEIEAEELARYRYMFGMERFDDRSEIRAMGGFDEALKTVRDNLAKGAGNLAKVYEAVYPERKLAVIGVAMNDKEYGEGWWANKIGPDHVAALPWEIFIVDGRIMALHGRFRTALSWPSLSMGQFMTIARHPDETLRMMEEVAGVKQ